MLPNLIRLYRAFIEKNRFFNSLPVICNSPFFAEKASFVIEQSQKNEVLIICNVNIDDLSDLNHHYGHDVMDKVLQKTAERICYFCGSKGIVGRVSGGEFLLMIRPVPSLDDIVPMLRHLKNSITKEIRYSNHPISLTASIGASIYPIEGMKAEMLIRHANQAMYLAKQAGKNRFEIYDSESAYVASNKSQKSEVLRQAIFNKELELYYQPKVDLHTGDILGMEALVRWQHPDKGILEPSLFLPDAFLDGVGSELGLWAIEAAIAQIEEWNNYGVSIAVSVNISAAQVIQKSFLNDVKKILQKYPLVTPQMLEFEILESDAIEDIDRLTKAILACQAIGFKFSLDDFGTGYSSLLHLKVFPAEYVKIDKAFVMGITKNPKDQALLHMMIKLSQVFNYQVVAEGVESAQHGTMLKEMGCRYVQGYFISKPIAAEDVLTWVTSYIPNKEWANAHETLPI